MARSRSRWVGAAAVGWVAALHACGAAQVRPADGGRRVVELEPIEFKADRSKGTPEVFVRDRDAMAALAMAALKAGRWDDGQKGFDRLVAEFGADPSAYAFAFNAGLCALRGGRPGEAADRFARSQALAKGTRNARDALFMRGEALEAAGRWADATQVYRGTLEDGAVQAEIGGKLGLLDEIEAWARLGIAFRRAREPKDADIAFKRVERLYEDNRETPVVADNDWVARAMFERSETFFDLFAAIRFKLPVERMQRELEDKSNLFLKAEGCYLRCVRLHHKPWSIACGYRVGALYLQFIQDVDKAEVPADLDAYTMEIYRDELWNHTERLAKRAILYFDRNLDLAERLGDAAGGWAEKSQQGKRDVEALVASNQARRARIAAEDAALLPATPTPTGLPGGGRGGGDKGKAKAR